MRSIRLVIAVAAVSLAPLASQAVTLGMIDTFQSGATEGWFAGGGPLGATPPVPPHVAPTGGPTGANDRYLVVTSQGGLGPGSRLVTMNGSQWAGDYLAAGIPTVEMDLVNLGTSDLFIRLLFENPAGGGPSDIAISALAFFLPAGSGWLHAVFPVSALAMVELLGSATDALSTTTLLRILHSPNPEFPPQTFAAQLGIDNISAGFVPRPGPFQVPEPSSLLLALTAAITVAIERVRRRTRIRA